MTDLNVEDIQFILRSHPDPLAAYMTRRGYDPQKGGRLLIPESVKLDWGTFGPPYYVRITPVPGDTIVLLEGD